MAKENFAILHGQVINTPKVYISRNTGQPIKAAFQMITVRRPFLRQGAVVPARYDYPIVWTSNGTIIDIIKNISAGDMVDVRGVYTTRNVEKSSVCECGFKNSTNGSKAFVTALYVCQREQKVTKEEALSLLQQRNEVSNVIAMIGNLCSEPDSYEDPDTHKTNTQYQLASNRLVRLHDGHEDEETDYPWIKSFGQQAVEDAKRLHKGSMVYISGSLQTREIIKKVICQQCGKEYNVRDTVMEITPYHVEYLANCDLRKMDEQGNFIDYDMDEAKENEG